MPGMNNIKFINLLNQLYMHQNVYTSGISKPPASFGVRVSWFYNLILYIAQYIIIINMKDWIL